MSNRKLILVKHALPIIDEEKASGEWHLSDEGKEKCRDLAKLLKDVHTHSIYSSYVPKAKETAEGIAEVLGCNVVAHENLHEHSRNEVNFMPRGVFIDTMMKFFQYPHALIFGEETANEAKNRFTQAVKEIVYQTPQEDDIVIVAHGTVNTLFVSEFNEINQFEFWNTLDLPSYVVLDANSFKLVELVEQVG
ncbi:histidine phosphatase family protein [Bacillus horti]|uniref:Broad specificity phosphatase PhoE n=1 Tax=Caldalkalibacillus horti TaxID=77523 RepID=A0ABT9VXR8_9BACI|nr:histidine phosphatase family protein [Bacillus horti]MDQ0165787.1 broad specificity phosphatase PhoE [Bacillus horti]